MAFDDRNFRYGYYEKVGFRGVEEKKSLDILLTEKPIDLLSKLSQFTLRFSLPGMYRMKVWKFLLGVTDPNSESNEFVIDEHRALCDDLRRALTFMLYCDESTPSSKLFVMMYLLEIGDLDEEFDKQLMKNEVMDLFIIADALTREFINDKDDHSHDDTYWLFRNLISAVKRNIQSLTDSCERFLNNLAVDDKVLYNHLLTYGIMMPSGGEKHEIRVFKNLPHRPFITWFVRFYAGIIDEQFLIRIFDRIVGAINHGTRPFLVLTSVGKALLSSIREELLQLSSAEEITKKLLSPLSTDQSEEIISKALTP